MFRILPVLMVAFGLFLAITSFASAATPELRDAQGLAVCVETTSEQVVTFEPPRQQKLVRCWRTVGMGIPVPSCQIEKGVPCASGDFAPRNGTGWPQLASPAGHDGPTPLADVPPPKA